MESVAAGAPTNKKGVRFRRGLAGRLVRALLVRPGLARRLPNRLRAAGWRWIGVDVGDDVYLSPEAKITWFLDRIHIGEGSLIGDGVELFAWEEIRIGRRVLVSQGAKLLTGSHNHHSPRFEGIQRPIRIGDYAWIGAYAILLPGVEVGEGAVVGAGAVVTRKVPAYTVVAGNPARIIGQREKLDFTYIPSHFP